jgi:hypothetical protein
MERLGAAERKRLLDPVDRISEILFGLIMAVTIVGSLSIASAGAHEVRSTMVAALGCNLAWGLVDAVMYLVRTLTERSRNLALARQVVGAEPAVAHRLIGEALPPPVARLVGPAELEAMRRRLLEMSLPDGAALHPIDFLEAFGIFVLVVLATFPVVAPFMLTQDAQLAMQISRVVTLVMLFFAGHAFGRHAQHPHPWRTGLAMALFGALLIAVVKALGG